MMSLLLGLAVRALGKARPVRRQQRAGLPALRPEQAAAGEPSHALASPSHEPDWPRHEPPAGTAIDAAIAPRVGVHGTERPGKSSPRSGPLDVHAAETPFGPARRAAHDPSLRTRIDALLPDPEPLLGPAAPPAATLPQPRAGQPDASRRERLPGRAAAAAAPTEVHVSIGRIELTALPASTPPRASKPKPHASNGNGLGDYLRGPRGSA